MMNLIEGQFHKKRITTEDIIIKVIEFLVVVIVLLFIAKVGVDAWVKEDVLRVDRLHQHQYDVALGVSNYGPAAPTGLKPNYGQPSERPHPSDLAMPKTRMFQDTSEKKGR